MRRTLLLLCLTGFFFCKESFSQAGMWTWMKGDSTAQSFGNYGIKGVPSPTNEPSARYACGSWTDTAGNFWIYGGNSFSSYGHLSDLWKFNPNTLEWTWLTGWRFYTDNYYMDTPVIKTDKGVFHPDNTPGARGFAMFTWTSPNNRLWFFGGLSPKGDDNSLWQYDPSINQWAWMGGSYQTPSKYGTKGSGDSSTFPIARTEGNAAWIDENGNLWFFGGHDFQTFNDLWRYEVNTMTWSWMSGSQNSPDTGVYGIKGVPSVDYYPSSRFSHMYWKDKEGDFWLVGGCDLTNVYQDVWKFNPKTLEWTWISGSKNNDTARMGAYCMEDINNKPGGRFENRASWKICDEVIITYSGLRLINYIGRGDNDIWAYLPSKDEWIKLSDFGPHYHRRGIKGVASPQNYPIFRFGSVGFVDRNRSIWMFAGQGDLGEFYNDLWKYNIDTACLPVSCSLDCEGISINIIKNGDTLSSFGASSYQWYLNGNKINGATNSVYVASEPGSYTLEITDGNGCTAMSAPVLISGVDEIEGEAVFIYPNPATSELIIQTDFRAQSVSVYDMKGSRVMENHFISRLDISSLATGVYFLELRSGPEAVRKRFVKM